MSVHSGLVAGWWEYQRLLHGTPDERHALQAGHPAHVYSSWTQVATRMTHGGLPALDLVVELVDTAPTDDALSLVGTGPLEDLVHKHGNVLVREVTLLASRSDRFARALSRVWVAHGVLNAEAEQRLSGWIIVSTVIRH
jgi:hypothetical protein